MFLASSSSGTGSAQQCADFLFLTPHNLTRSFSGGDGRSSGTSFHRYPAGIVLNVLKVVLDGVISTDTFVVARVD